MTEIAPVRRESTGHKQDDSLCPVCHDRMEIFALGRCDHIICFRCAVRMRVLCEQMYCAICRTDLLQVVFVRRRQKFEDINTSSFCINREHKFFSEDSDIDAQYRRLLEHRCKVCPTQDTFKTFDNLRDHMKRKHTLFYCNLCVDHLKLFSDDRKFYNRADLGRHRRLGDEDDRSYKAHPLCQFCDERFFDNDELLRHLRKEHFFCHFCEADGITNEYFSNYVLLREHFKTAHVLCEEGACRHAEFTNAFRSDIDYRAHWAQHHSAGAGRQHARQMRQIDISVDYGGRGSGASATSAHDGRRAGGRGRGSGRDTAPREEAARNSARYLDNGTAKQTVRERREVERKRREELDEAHALSASLAGAQRQGHISVIDRQLAQHTQLSASTSSTHAPSAPAAKYTGRAEDFPTLAGAPTSHQPDVEQSDAVPSEEKPNRNSEPTMAKKLAMKNRFSVSNGAMNSTDFPSLPSSRPVKTKKVAMTEVDFPSLTCASVPVRSQTTALSAWNSTGIGSQELSTKSSVTSRPLAKSEDFPNLARTVVDAAKPTGVLVESLAAVSRNFSSGSLSAMAEQTDKQPSWGPELNRKPEKTKQKSGPEVDRFLHLKSAKKAPNSPASQARKEDISRPSSAGKSSVMVNPSSARNSTPVETSQGNSEDYSAKADQSEKKWTFVGAEGAKSGKTVKNVDTKKGQTDRTTNVQKQPNKTSIKAEDTDVKDHAAGSKTGEKEVKKTTKPVAKEDSGYHSMGGKEKLSKKQKGSKTVTEGKSSAESPTASSKKHAKVASETMQTEKSIKSSVDEADSGQKYDKMLPDLPANSNGTADVVGVNGQTSTQSISDEEINLSSSRVVFNSAENAQPETSVPAFTASDFPALASFRPVSAPLPVTSVPPGFSSVPLSSAKPPPGFAAPVISSRHPPGLVPASGYPCIPSVSDSCKAERANATVISLAEAKYIPPRNAQQRNIRLVERITASVKDSDLGAFRKLSADFRTGEISARGYHDGCQAILDPLAFSAVFPELIALLPDLPKQQELLAVHREFLSSSLPVGKSRTWSGLPDDGLQTCSVCSQVLCQSDQQEHASEHANFNMDFPTLTNTSLCSVR